MERKINEKNDPALDIKKLMSAIDNEENEGMLNINYERLNKAKVDALTELFLNGDADDETEEAFLTIQKQLKEYRYVDQIKDIHYGSYLRWISLKPQKNRTIKLTTGGLVCDLPVSKTSGEVNIVCRNNMHRFFTVKMNENIIFQKLTDQEQVILAAVNYLQI